MAKKQQQPPRPYMCPEYEYNGGVPPVYVKGAKELEAERIVAELSIKHGSVGRTSDITDEEKRCIENAKKNGINYGFFWKHRPLFISDEMNEIEKASIPFEDEFSRLRARGLRHGNAYDKLYVEKDPDWLKYVDTRRACAVFDTRYIELRDLENPWYKYGSPKPKLGF